MILYKRNSQGKPLFWSIQPTVDYVHKEPITINYGLVGTLGRTEFINTHRDVNKEIDSLIASKRKEGYKSLTDLRDNAPEKLPYEAMIHYLNTYLPKFNTHEDGKFIPMLCKTLEDNKPFEKGSYFGQWKINGERCIITAKVENNLFRNIRLQYRSREGIDWTDKLNYLDAYLLNVIPRDIIDMMIEEGVGLDGELYLPGYGINEINSFIKNTEVPQHYQLQYWLYDICIENMNAINRQRHLDLYFHRSKINSKEEHLNNKDRLIVLPNFNVDNINVALTRRDNFISLGFEGLVIRKADAEYQFGGKRNNNMLKFKKIYDGWFKIIDIVPEGKKRANLGKFVLRNDINDEIFECTYNAPYIKQEEILINKDKYIGHLAFVEYRERAGVKQCPFHAKAITIRTD